MVYKMKRSFILLVTLGFVLLLSLYMINIIENKTLLSNIVKLKYLNLQLQSYKQNIIQYIQSHTDAEIENLKLNDNRYILNITKEMDNNKTIYTVELKASFEPIRDIFMIEK